MTYIDGSVAGLWELIPASFHCPKVLTIWGAHSPFVKVLGDNKYFGKAIPHSTVVMFEDGDHWLPLTKPKQVASHVQLVRASLAHLSLN